MAAITLDVTPTEVDIVGLWRGDRVVRIFDATSSSDGSAIDLTGRDFLCVCRVGKDSSSAILNSFTVWSDDPTHGKISVAFQVTDDHPTSSYYDLQINDFDDGQPFTIIQGKISSAGQRSIDATPGTITGITEPSNVTEGFIWVDMSTGSPVPKQFVSGTFVTLVTP